MSTGNALTTLTQTLATKLNMGDGAQLVETLKATAFKGQVSDAQMTALLVVANQYGLNPWTKEIYAFPDKNNGIVPVVGVDGWSRIINGHPQFDGIEFDQDSESCTCRIFRKDRSHATSVTEWMSECKRANVGPWQSHPKRMLRHKAMIQCARLAFGYGGIFDQDEAERIAERDITPAPQAIGKQAANGKADDPRRDILLEAARNLAMEGNVDNLRTHFRNLTPEERAIIGTDEMAKLGAEAVAIAEKANTPIDVPFEEVV
ncbi:phage recombination protein Bet [Silvimonas soli]|uniref:phage recombination protein Bet n=1 Tax=Silvimonas soli TaxID=2980100 RepID=UPI0024B3466F|nr:phage recombination protein Bet [Silvimonas soli]